MSSAVPEDRGKGDTDDSRQSAAPPPLMSEDTFNSLFKQMWEGGGQNNSSVSFDLPDCSSDDIPQVLGSVCVCVWGGGGGRGEGGVGVGGGVMCVGGCVCLCVSVCKKIRP